MFLKQVERCLAVPRRALKRPRRADCSCIRCLGAQLADRGISEDPDLLNMLPYSGTIIYCVRLLARISFGGNFCVSFNYLLTY